MTYVFNEADVEYGPEVYVYEIKADPLGYCNNPNRKLWSLQNQAKITMELALLNQHKDKKFTGPIEMNIMFYMPMLQKSQKHSPKSDGAWHQYRPDLIQLISFVTKSASLILFADDCIISSVEATKIFSSKPRTIFTIRELK